MNIKDILKKPTLDENDMKIIRENRHLLSDADLVRLGFKTAPNVAVPVDNSPVPEAAPEPVAEPTAPAPEAPKRGRKGSKK